MAIITCETCQSVFEGRSNRKYCCVDCRRKAEMDARKRKKPEGSRRKMERCHDQNWGPPTDWSELQIGWDEVPTDWDDLPKWESTPEEQKAWKDELASLPTLDELMNKPPVKGQKKGGKQ